MCGLKPCRKCAAKNKIGKMPRKNFNSKSIVSVAKDGLMIYAGYAAGKALVNNVSQLQANPLFGIGAQLAASIILSKGRSPVQKTIASGMAVSAMQSAVNALLPNLSEQIGINGPWGSYLNMGVAGRVGAVENTRPIIRVQ